MFCGAGKGSIEGEGKCKSKIQGSFLFFGGSHNTINLIEMTFNRSIPIWLDCDPGQDDTVALIVACYSKYFKLLGVSTVHGNVSLKNTTSNALRVLTAIGRTDIPVYPGASNALNNYQNVFAEDVHGKTGLNGSDLLPKAKVEAHDHNDFFPQLAKTIEAHSGEICIITTGPLTNIAIFFEEYPHLKTNVKWLSVMGGGFEVSNITDNAEFNFYCDPYAAQKVLEDPSWSNKLILSSLDITTTVFISNEVQSKILASETIETASNFRAMMFELVDSTNKRMLAKHLASYKGPVIHDPVALVALLLFENVKSDLDIKYERRSFTIGTQAPYYGSCMNVEHAANGVFVLTSLNVAAFWDFVLSVYKICDEHAYMNTVLKDELRDEYYNHKSAHKKKEQKGKK